MPTSTQAAPPAASPRRRRGRPGAGGAPRPAPGMHLDAVDRVASGDEEVAERPCDRGQHDVVHRPTEVTADLPDLAQRRRGRGPATVRADGAFDRERRSRTRPALERSGAAVRSCTRRSASRERPRGRAVRRAVVPPVSAAGRGLHRRRARRSSAPAAASTRSVPGADRHGGPCRGAAPSGRCRRHRRPCSGGPWRSTPIDPRSSPPHPGLPQRAPAVQLDRHQATHESV